MSMSRSRPATRAPFGVISTARPPASRSGVGAGVTATGRSTGTAAGWSHFVTVGTDTPTSCARRVTDPPCRSRIRARATVARRNAWGYRTWLRILPCASRRASARRHRISSSIVAPPRRGGATMRYAARHLPDGETRGVTANLRQAQITADRWQALLETDSVSKQETDQAVSALSAMKATVNSNAANVRRLEQLQGFEKI